MSERFSFRKFVRADYPLMSRWLQQPHVGRWWADDFTLAGLEAHYGDTIDGREPSFCFVAEQGGRPVGFVQYLRIESYPEYIEELVALLALPPRVGSMDYLIGDPADVGRGLGAQMLRAFVEHIWRADPEMPALVVPVHQQNVASWRVLEKIGFTRVASGELDPDNPADSRDHFVYRLDRT